MRYKVGLGASPVVLVVKNPPAGEVRDTGSTPGLGRSPGGGNGNPLQCFSWRIPQTEDPGGLQSIASQRVSQDWSDWAGTHAGLLLKLVVLWTCLERSHFTVLTNTSPVPENAFSSFLTLFSYLFLNSHPRCHCFQGCLFESPSIPR